MLPWKKSVKLRELRVHDIYVYTVTLRLTEFPVCLKCVSLPLAQSINLFQNQRCFHTLSVISSIWTFFVSGSKNRVQNDITNTQAEKKTKMANFVWQSMERKAWAMMKVKSMLTQIAVSSGNVSLGINYPSGPQDHTKEAKKMQTISTAWIAYPWVRHSELWSLSLSPNSIAVTIWERNIWTPASKSSARRPTLSTK